MPLSQRDGAVLPISKKKTTQKNEEITNIN